MLIMTSIIRVGQSKFVTVPIDEDSQERIMNCLQTLSDLKIKDRAEEVFLKDTKAAYSKMIRAQEVRSLCTYRPCILSMTNVWMYDAEKSGGEKGERGQNQCGAG